MPNRNYISGRRVEYELMQKILKKHPTAFVTRSAGSHSAIDVIAVYPSGKNTLIGFYQLKSGSARLSPEEEKKIEKLAELLKRPLIVNLEIVKKEKRKEFKFEKV
jgi:hypothetical protein